ncbi:hypothetical protein PACID_33130 [Acidipropionibacterium acidipropionici ATCC 4875]|uniref:Uncharacterized protein n=1 Tax=Acidipropionibacterium acidipropionici (strain ATCC 4875 / DSM 20272 / JCM 6432 / NBRC 12425 / NCIMB 8070 / 4) TaxID=1171373 RepID=K7RX88_ACIA4|nr:hypothetical protein PACID_33130 [Acidipropionibacterium acidipropionici ATCC 4875]
MLSPASAPRALRPRHCDVVGRVPPQHHNDGRAPPTHLAERHDKASK